MTWLRATIRAIITPIILTFIDIIGTELGEVKCVSGQCRFDFRLHLCVYICSNALDGTCLVFMNFIMVNK
jgi:hypothetical protein